MGNENSRTSIMFTLFFIAAVVAISSITSTMQYELEYQVQEAKTGWNTAIFEKHCKSEPQPVVEYYDFNETQYLLFSQQMTWDEAQLLCSYYNAKLAILDTMEKAMRIAESIADSNIDIEEDSWLGGRRLGNTWSWMYDRVGSQKNSEIPVQPNVEDYPPWVREPSRPMKDCLAIDRRAHSHPNFIDLDCRLQRPFICEKRPEEGVGKPIPSKLVQIQRHTYTFYHAKFTWEEAAIYCRLLGARLAMLTNSDVIGILANTMTKARPDFETVWIGAHYTYEQWVWISTGTSLESTTDENGYPPWRSGRSERNDGCLLLDRHMDNMPSFIETRCDRKRDFICEEYPKDELNDLLNEPMKITYNDSIYVIYPMEKTWQESDAFCNEQGSVLAYMNDINVTNLIVEAMGDHPKDISHMWIGGNLIKKNEWQWTLSGHKIANEKDSFGFPPWTNMSDEQLDRYTGRTSTCLNLDRSDHVRPHFYGLDCNSKQPFVCKITCKVTPPVNNGSWICEDTPEGKHCELRCDHGFTTMGIGKIFCIHRHGWNTVKNWLEIPLCLESKDYARRMVRSLDHDLRSSAGYYFILDHTNEKMQSLSLRFTKQILNIFPMNYNLKMGMYCTNPPTQLPFNQTDTCATLNTINTKVAKKSNVVGDLQLHSDWHEQLSMHKGRKIVIFIIIDVKHISRHLEILAYMKTNGNQIVAIGLEEDWETLLALASIGFDRRKNLYLFNNGNLTGFETIINELHNFQKRTLKCPKSEIDLIDIHSEKNNKTATNSSSSRFAQKQNNTKSQKQVSSEIKNSKDQGLKLLSSKDNDSTNTVLTAENKTLKTP